MSPRTRTRTRTPRPTSTGPIWWQYVRRHAPGETPPSYAEVAAYLGTSRQRVGAAVTGPERSMPSAEWIASALDTLSRHGWPPGEVVLATDGTMTILPRPRATSGARR